MKKLIVFDNVSEANAWSKANTDRITVEDVSVAVCIWNVPHPVIAVIYQELMEVK